MKHLNYKLYASEGSFIDLSYLHALVFQDITKRFFYFLFVVFGIRNGKRTSSKNFQI